MRNDTSKSRKFAFNEFLRVIRKSSFNKEITKLRLENKIPKNGFKNKNLVSSIPTKEDGWVYGNNKKSLSTIFIELRKITRAKFPISDEILDLAFRHYFFYNQIPENFINEHFMDSGLCIIADLPKDLNEAIINPLENEREKSISYPIAIKITPYTSRNVLVEFIDKNQKKIKTLQKKYELVDTRLGKTRSRVANKRHQQIIDLHKKYNSIETSRKMKKDYGWIDPDTIRKVVSRRKKEL